MRVGTPCVCCQPIDERKEFSMGPTSVVFVGSPSFTSQTLATEELW
jgi:hypothetical protein